METLDFSQTVECSACGNDCGWDGRVVKDPINSLMRRGLVFLCPVCLNAGAVFGGEQLYFFFNLPKFSPKKVLPFRACVWMNPLHVGGPFGLQ